MVLDTRATVLTKERLSWMIWAWQQTAALAISQLPLYVF